MNEEQKVELKLIHMEEVVSKEVSWLWYPYIPYGKITVIEGDPGEGKTTLVLKLAAMLSKGLPLPCDDDRPYEPIHIIYQTAEDGIDDTIKPRLEQNGADCSMIRVIDETEKELSMTDERLEQAIVETNAKLIILDPIQAYIGATVDMHRANEIRPVLKKLGMIAEKYQCAVILIGHMNKASGSKSTYRGLGSIDIQATARSVLLDLLIVVGMFLTGFDAPTLNTLFVDKNLRYHGLMQAFSRTNRIYDSTKTFGNIVTFRDLEQATIDAIKCFGDDNTKNIVLEKSYQEYMNGFKDIVTGEARRGYVDVVQELKSRFADVDEITTEKEKKEFVKLFGEYLKIENILQNYDEFTNLKELQKIDLADSEALEIFKSTHFVSDEDIKAMQLVDILEERTVQDYRSKYNDIREWIRREREGKEKGNSKIDWDDVVFEVDLLKSQEINLDYILELIYEKNKNTKDKNMLIDEIRRIVRASTGNRAKESLIVAFINQTDLDEIQDKASIIDAFFQFAQKEQKREAEELIMEEKLNEEAAKRYILTSLRKEYASENGTDLNEILPKMSPLNPQYHTKKQSVFEKISTFVEKFKGVGGVI